MHVELVQCVVVWLVDHFPVLLLLNVCVVIYQQLLRCVTYTVLNGAGMHGICCSHPLASDTVDMC